MGRPSVDQYFMDMTHLVKSRGTCPRRQVGAVVVKDKHVLTTGYNGAPKGFPHPLDEGCIRDELGIPSGSLADVCPCLHAEQNAIIQAAGTGVSISGGDLYCTTQPCTQCSRMIANAGLKRVVFEHEYADPLAIGLLTTAGVELWQWDDERKVAERYTNTNTWAEAQDELRKKWNAGEILPMAGARTPLGTHGIEHADETGPVPVVTEDGAPAADEDRGADDPKDAADAADEREGEDDAEDAGDEGEDDGERDDEDARPEPVRIRDISSDPRRAELIKKLARERIERERQRGR